MTRQPLTIGVLGGMGPAATVDFLSKLVANQDARCDQDHVPIVVWSDPKVPDRSTALLSPDQPQPGPSLIRGARKLASTGADLIAIACNTAHHWFDEIQAAVDVPVLHIADAVALELKRMGAGPGATLGLMCTRGTIRSGFYHRWLGAAGYHVLVPGDDLQTHIDAAIRAVKAGNLEAGRDGSATAARALASRGAHALLLACTELPVVLRSEEDGPSLVDATAALARACVQRATARTNSDYATGTPDTFGASIRQPT